MGALVALDKSIDISGMALKLLGRNPDLSSRTLLWDAALHEKFNSLHGVGFYAFWDTERGAISGMNWISFMSKLSITATLKPIWMVE